MKQMYLLLLIYSILVKTYSLNGHPVLQVTILIADANGHVRQVYCHMGILCNKQGGWRRVAHLNMTDNDEVCPEQFRQYPLANDQSDHKGVRACGRPTSSGGSCAAIKFLIK